VRQDPLPAEFDDVAAALGRHLDACARDVALPPLGVASGSVLIELAKDDERLGGDCARIEGQLVRRCGHAAQDEAVDSPGCRGCELGGPDACSSPSDGSEDAAAGRSAKLNVAAARLDRLGVEVVTVRMIVTEHDSSHDGTVRTGA